MKIQYEIAVLYDPDLEIDLEKTSAKIEKIFTGNGSKIVNVDNWGRRKLAYPIKNHEHAVYVFYTLELPPENVRKIENTLNITDEVIRFLITRPDLKAIAKAELAKADKLKKVANQEVDEDEDEAENNDEERYNPSRNRN